MKTKLFTFSGWLLTHRVQLQVTFFMFIFSLTLVALFATGSSVWADQIIISGH